jgi:hypothetical protein
MKHTTTSLGAKLSAAAGLLKLTEAQIDVYMNTYGALFVDSPENTLGNH